jgi:hypothetical protein
METNFKLDTDDVTIEVTQKPKTHNSYTLTDYDVDLIKLGIERQTKWLESVIEKLPTYNENASETSIDQVRDSLSNQHFDLLGLIAMIKEGVAIQCVIPKEVTELGWTFRGHSVDMPPPYCHNDERHTKSCVKEVSNPKTDN